MEFVPGKLYRTRGTSVFVKADGHHAHISREECLLFLYKKEEGENFISFSPLRDEILKEMSVAMDSPSSSYYDYFYFLRGTEIVEYCKGRGGVPLKKIFEEIEP